MEIRIEFRGNMISIYRTIVEPAQATYDRVDDLKIISNAIWQRVHEKVPPRLVENLLWPIVSTIRRVLFFQIKRGQK